MERAELLVVARQRALALEDDDYAWMTRELMQVANRHAEGRIVSMLEGGYNLAALGRSAVAHVRTLATAQ